MQHSPPVPWRALKAAFGLGAAVAASLGLASAASAAVIPITPDGFGNTATDHLGAAIATANTNSSTSNTITLAPGIYNLGGGSFTGAPSQPFTITKNLTITADHTYQTAGGTPTMEINGAAADLKGANNLFIVPSGVTLTIEGLNLDAGGGPSFAVIVANGNAVLDGVTLDGSAGNSFVINGGGSVTMNESMINSDNQDAVVNSGTFTMNNSDIVSSAGNGVDNNPGYAMNLNNSMLLFQVGPECLNGAATNGGPGSIDDDGTCGVQYSDQTGADNLFPLNDNGNGGPATTDLFPANNGFTSGLGVNCPTADERFFPNPVSGGVRHCDIGADTTGNTLETTVPSCTVTGGTPGQTQQVTLTDGPTGGGIGPAPGPGTDNPTNTPATAYPPPAAVPVFGYPVSNEQINNGSIAFTPFTMPTSTGLVLTATKSVSGTVTQWSFTGQDWAGVSKNCF